MNSADALLAANEYGFGFSFSWLSFYWAGYFAYPTVYPLSAGRSLISDSSTL